MSRWILVLLLCSCGDSGPSELTRADVAGVFSLRLVNGAPLPFESAGQDVRVLASEVHLTDLASAAFLLRTTEPLDRSTSPSQTLLDIGWGIVPPDSLVLNIIFPLSLQEHGGHFDGTDTVEVEGGGVLPPGRFLYVREGR